MSFEDWQKDNSSGFGQWQKENAGAPVVVVDPVKAEEVAKKSLDRASEFGLSIGEAEFNYTKFEAAPEESRLSEMFQRYIRDPITEKTGLFPYVTDFGDPRRSEMSISEKLSELKTEIPVALLRTAVKAVSGVTLNAADVAAQEFDRYVLGSDKPVTTAEDLVEKITGLQAKGEAKKAAEMTGSLFGFLGGMKTAKKILGPLMNRLPVREGLRYMFGGLTQLGGVTLSEETSLKVTTGKDIDWGKVRRSAGWGVIFGGAESLVGKFLRYRDVKEVLKFEPRLKQVPKDLLNRVAEAGRAKAGGMTKKAWMKVYGEDMKKFVDHVQQIAETPLLPEVAVGKAKPVVAPVEPVTKPTAAVKPTKPKVPAKAPVKVKPLEAKQEAERTELVVARGTRAAADIGGIQAVGAKKLKEANRILEKAGEQPVSRNVKRITVDFLKDLYSKKKPPVIGDSFTDSKGFRIEVIAISETPTGTIAIDYQTFPKKGAGRTRTLFVDEIVPTAKQIEAQPTPTEQAATLKKVAPPVGGREAGFVDLTPLVEAGQQVRAVEEKATKLVTRFTGLDKPVQKALIEYEEQIKELPTIAANISKEAGFVKLTEEQERLLEDFVEQGEKFPEKFPEGLPPELEEAHANLTAGIENARERLQNLGVSADWPKGQIEFLKEKLKSMKEVEQPDIAGIKLIEQSIDDLSGLEYIHHAYSDTPNKAIKNFFGKKKITKKPIGLLGRKFPTLESAEKAGFTRAPLAVSYADMWHKVMRAEQADALIKTINDNPNLSAWAEVAPNDWVTVPEDIFPSSRSHSTFVQGGKIRKRTRVRKYPVPIADALMELTYTRGTHALEAAYDKFNLTMKLIGFYNPIVMGKNDVVQAWRGGGLKGIISMPKALKTFLTKDATYHKLRKGGLFNNVVNYGPSVEVITQNMVDKVRLTSGEKVAKIAKQWLNPKNFMDNLKLVQENTTWNMDEVIRISLWHAVEDSKMLEGMSEFEKIEWVNDAMVNYGKFPKETKRWATKAVYVPTYRIGNFRFFWGQLAKHPWKFKGPMLRTLGYRAFVQWGMPAMVASIIAFKTKRKFDEVKGDVFVERGYRLVIHNPETNSDTVYALSDPLLEGQKLTQREFRRTLELNMAAAPAFILRVLQGRKRTATEDPLGEFFKLGTPIYRDIVNAKAKDKTRVQKILTHLAIAFTYKRQGRSQDKVNMYEQTARTLSLWTDWQAQKADLKAIWTGKTFFYGPGGKFGRLVREFEADKKIQIAKTDKEIDIALAKGDNAGAVKVAIEDKRYKSKRGIADRFLRWHQPLVYLDKTMPKDDKGAFIKWLKENKHMSDEDLVKLIEATR